ncbi:hypothetical protein [Bdellovibrio reynosensis]|uniref:Uncharacterized protein n=1 Tax=Bdellovibrio reynosensis TaxID=2835041 RepID=A0ABY4C409_9BACT|nr:hypothetical protein [Bdellovibrio reynosensis]UOE99707.1 hypothetical protein MNR06_08365 [Bdellovibrio reynosensis]
MLRNFKIIIFVLVLSCVYCTSFAQSTRPSASGDKKERKATLNFEDELVEGSTQKPELFYLFQKKNFNYKRLIKLRENFLPEMRRTTEDIQRVRGVN